MDKISTGEAAKDWISNLEKFGSKPGLSRVEWLLEQLNSPQVDLSIIHVAGTNGKGSTCHIMKEVLVSNGYRVGLFTSPFVDDFSERISCNDQTISNEQLVQFTNKIKELSEQRQAKGLDHPTQFEVITVLALLYYKQVQPDLVIMETGLGGRMDATNVIDPVISVITNVGYDHINVLGESLEEIAFEKAGIIKNNNPVVTGVSERSPSVLQVINDKCSETDSKLYIMDRDYQVNRSIIKKSYKSLKKTSKQWYGNIFDYQGLNMKLQGLELSMIGPIQIQNAGTALYTLELLWSMGYIVLEEGKIRQGLTNVTLPVRIEYWSNYELDFIFDASHNPEGVSSLMKAINELREIQKWDKVIYVIGMLADKPVEQSLDNISVLPQEFIVTSPDNSRALSPKILSNHLKKRFPQCEITVSEELFDAIQLGITKGRSQKENSVLSCKSDDGEKNLVVFWGSFYLAVIARKKIQEIIKH